MRWWNCTSLKSTIQNRMLWLPLLFFTRNGFFDFVREWKNQCRILAKSRRTTPSTMYHRHSLLSCTVSKTSDNSNLHNLYAWLCVLRISHHANTPWLLLLILADTKGKTIRYWPDRSLKPIMVQNQGGNNPEGVNHITSSYPVKDDFNLFFPKRWLSISKYGYPILFKPTVEFANLAYDPG